MALQPVPEGLFGLLAQACFGVTSDGSQGPLAPQCETIISEDRTKVQFMNQTRAQAHSFAAGWSDIGALPGELYRIEPRVATFEQEPLLQIADVMAYASSHSKGTQPSSRFFAEQWGRVALSVSSSVTLDFSRGPWVNSEPLPLA